MRELLDRGVERIVGIVLAPTSRPGIAQYRSRAEEAAAEAGVPVTVIESWHEEPGYLGVPEPGDHRRLRGTAREARESVELAVTAHSLPVAILERGGHLRRGAGRTRENLAGRPEFTGTTTGLAECRTHRRRVDRPGHLRDHARPEGSGADGRGGLRRRVRFRPPRGQVRHRLRGKTGGQKKRDWPRPAPPCPMTIRASVPRWPGSSPGGRQVLKRAVVVGAGIARLTAASATQPIRPRSDGAGSGPPDRGRILPAEFSGRLVDTGPDALRSRSGAGRAARTDRHGRSGSRSPIRPAFRLTAAGELEPYGVGGGAMFGLFGGIFSLPARLEELLGSRAKVPPQVTVDSVRQEDRSVLVEAEGSEGGPGLAVVATGARAAGRLLDGETGERLAAIRGVSVVSFTSPSRRGDRPRMNGTGYLADPADGRLVTGCSWSSAKWKRLAGDQRSCGHRSVKPARAR